MTDLHVHTKFSFDSDEDIEKYLDAAVRLGDGCIGFCDHVEHNMLEFDPNFPLPDFSVRHALIKKLKSEFGIKILEGVELGFSENSISYYKKLIDEQRFDYSIMSVHTVPERGDCYYPSFYEDLDRRDAYSLYLDEVYKSLNANIDFQIVGHIGYIARYAPFEPKLLAYNEFVHEIDRIFLRIVDRDLALELNTSAAGLDVDFVPTADIVGRYAELGGRKFTFGSDAHSVSAYSQGKERVKSYLHALGIDHTFRYENRIPIKESF